MRWAASRRFSAEQGTDGGELRQLMDLLRSVPNFQQAQTGLKPLIASRAAGLEPGVTFEEGAFALLPAAAKSTDKCLIWLANNTGKHRDCVLRVVMLQAARRSGIAKTAQPRISRRFRKPTEFGG